MCKAQEKRVFQSLEEVLALTKEKNFQFKNTQLQNKLADLTYKSSLGNLINPRIPASVQIIDNISLQKNFLPGTIFGMPEGTFREVTLGQRYATSFNIQPQFDIINVANWHLVKSAKINKQLTENQNKLAEKKIYDQINAIYHNILSFQGQKKVLQEHLSSAEKLVAILKNRFKEGVSRKQELNEAEINTIYFQDKISQVDFAIHQQKLALSLFFENEILPEINDDVWKYQNENASLQPQSNLVYETQMLQQQLVEQDYKIAKYQHIPVLSFVSSWNWNYFSSQNVFNHGKWIDFSYYGLKLSFDLPTSIPKLTQYKNTELKLELLKNATEHTQKEAENLNQQMILDYQKSIAQLDNLEKIYLLKKDTYEKNNNQYLENILPLEKLLISQNEMLNSQLNQVSVLAQIGFNKHKILINNQF